MFERTGRQIIGSQWSLCAFGVFALVAIGCDKQNEATGGDDEAEAVEADQQETDKTGDEEASEKSGSASKDESHKEDGNEAPETATVGKPAPDFTLADETGEEHTLSDYRGETVVLEWTNPECPYVQRHYKSETMTKTLEKLGGADEVTWLAIDSSHFNKPEDSKAWKKKQGFDYPVLQDPEGKVGQTYGAKTTPHMYVIDDEGVLRYKGAIDDSPNGEKDDPTNYALQAVQALHNDAKVEPKTTKPYGCSVKYDG
jgi:peroxiredoxin